MTDLGLISSSSLNTCGVSFMATFLADFLPELLFFFCDDGLYSDDLGERSLN